MLIINGVNHYQDFSAEVKLQPLLAVHAWHFLDNDGKNYGLL